MSICCHTHKRENGDVTECLFSNLDTGLVNFERKPYFKIHIPKEGKASWEDGEGKLFFQLLEKYIYGQYVHKHKTRQTSIAEE